MPKSVKNYIARLFVKPVRTLAFRCLNRNHYMNLIQEYYTSKGVRFEGGTVYLA